jgi:hypothetical protein
MAVEFPKPINVDPLSPGKRFYDPPKIIEFGLLILHTNTSLNFELE